MAAPDSEPLAIVGIGCLFPSGGTTPAAFWANVRTGVDSIREVPPSHWRPEDYHDADPKAPDRVYTIRGGFLDPVPFNPGAFGIPPTSLEATDTSQLLGLVAAQNALLDAGYHVGPAEEAGKKGLRPLDRRKVSVLLGVTGTLELVVPLGARLGHPRWRQALRDAGVSEDVAQDVIDRISAGYVPWQENSFPGLLGNVVAGRIANKLDLGGTNCVVDAACASSLSAIHLAALELQSGKADVVLSGGVDTFNDIFMFMCFSKTPALSPTGDSRPFEATGDGTILGEGLGLVVLKRLADARRDGDRVYAVLRGIGTSSDGKGGAVYAPRVEGQVACLRDAYRQAGVSPDTIELVEAHGTGTRVGDATEVQALTQVYREASRTGRWCALGSVKSQIGHTKAAAGAAGLIKAALALYHKVLPPTLKVTRPLEILESDTSPFYVNTAPRPWPASGEHPRRAALSAFGFGGSNFHAVLEEAGREKPTATWDDGRVQIVALSGNSPAELLAGLRGLESLDAVGLRTRAAESRASFRTDAPHRLALVLQHGTTDLAKLLTGVRERLEKQPDRAWRVGDAAFHGVGPRRPLAVLFSGQGSQYCGMLRDLVTCFPEAFDELGRAEAARRAISEEGLVDRLYPLVSFTAEDRKANEARLRATDVAQPALGAVSLGAYRVLQTLGLKADAFAGHSFGELTALCAADSLTTHDFHALAAARGRCMAEAGRKASGGMLAVHAPAEAITPILDGAGIRLTVANKNAPEQTVLSGSLAEIARAEEALTPTGYRFQILPVDGAFHSPLVAEAAEPFEADVRKVAWHPGRVPVYANTTAERYPDEPDAARSLLAGQLARPVEFVRQIQALHDAGLRDFLEVGPGGRLVGLVERILHGRPFQALALDASRGGRSGLADLASTVAWLAAQGQAVELTRWDAGWTPPVADRKPALIVPLTGANYVAPRPPIPPRPAAPVKSEPAPVTPRQEASPVATAPAPLPRPVAPSPQPIPSRPTPMTAPTPAVVNETLAALLAMQEQTAQLHRQFLEGQEATQRSIHLLLERQALPASVLPLPIPAPVTPPVHAVVVPYSPVRPESRVEPPRPATPTPTVAAPAVAPPAVVPPPSPPPTAPGHAVTQTLLAVVAEKTGYPAEMLDLDMTLDADLGIDSIKRVEILSAMQERLPDAPVVKPDQLGTLQTLRQILDHLGQPGVGTATPANVTTAAPAANASGGRLVSVLLDVVAEKTGYPTEMLDLDMTLDADLGIDSIKRVEILSAIQERVPEAPTVKPEQLGSLQTLRQIVDHLGLAGDSVPAIKPAPQPSAAPQLTGELLAVVAEKTGYPIEMLDLGMSLDADLGIDSIKRVEILSALQERLPDVPPVEPQHLGTLQTLRQIIDHLAGSPAPAVTAPKPPVLPAATSLERSVLKREPLPALAGRSRIRLPEGRIVIGGSDDLALALAVELGSPGQPLPVVPVERLTTDAIGPVAALILIAPEQAVEATFLRDALLAVQKLGPGAGLIATVTRLDGAFGLHGVDPSIRAVAGGLAGLTKTVGHEWQTVSARAFDISPRVNPEQAAHWLASELFHVGPVETCLDTSGPGCLERIDQPQRPPESLSLSPGDVVVVSGGARGVTAEVAVALAQAVQPTLVLLGRSELGTEPAQLNGLIGEADLKRALLALRPGTSPRALGEEVARIQAAREVRQTLARIEQAGARAIYRAVDVRDRNATVTALAEAARTLGPIRGLIHGAGVLADARIEDKTPAQVEAVFGPKIDGLAHLLAGCEEQALRAIVLFSSTTARLGRRGQVDYAMANEVLNKEACRLAVRLPDCRVLSVGWGPWEGGMVSPGLKKIFEAEGVGLIPLTEGARWLVRELAVPRPSPVEVVVLATPTRPASPSRVVVPERSLATGSPDAGEQQGFTEPLTLAFKRVIDVESHPVLVGHVLDDRPVLPLAVTLEYVGHAAMHLNPGLHFHGCNDLRMFQGITLEAGPRTIELMGGKTRKSDGLFLAPVELRSRRPDGRTVLHARAEVVLASTLPPAPAPRVQMNLASYAFSPDAIYDQFLFHGPELMAIEAVEGCGKEGIQARLRPAPLPAGWITQPLRPRWLADPLVLDGVFQLMILWTRQQHQAPSLPCRVGQYRQYRRAFPSEPIRAVLRIVKQLTAQAVTEVELTTLSGELIGRLDEVEVVLDPALQGAFSRNRLPLGRM